MRAPAASLPKWKKRVLWALALLVVARLAIAVGVPIAIRHAASKYDLDCDWNRLNVSILGGSVEVKGFELRPQAPRGTAPPPAPIARFESANVDLAMLDLLRLHPRGERGSIDGLELHLWRGETGPWNFERHLPRAEATIAAPADAGATRPARTASVERDGATEEPPAYDLALPVEIDALRAHNVVVFVEDRGATPAVTTRFELHASAWHLGAADRVGRLDMTATSSGLLEALTVVGELETSTTKARARFEARIAGLRPKAVAGWLTSIGIEPRADRLSFTLDSEVQAETIGEERRALKASLALHNVRALVDEGEHAALDSLRVDVSSITPSRVVVPAVEVTGARLRGERLANGHLLALGFEIGELPPARQADTAPETSAPTALPAWGIERITLREMGLSFVDRSVEPVASVELAHGVVEIAHMGVDPTRPSEPLTVDARVEAGGIARMLSARGTVDVLNARKTVQLELDAQQVTLASIAGYLRAVGVEPTLVDGTMHAKVDARAHTDAQGRTTGELHLTDIVFTDTTELFALRGVDVSGIDFDSQQHLLRCAGIEIQGTHVPARREATGAIAAFGVRTLATQPAAPIGAKISSPDAAARSGAVQPSTAASASSPSATTSASAPLRVEIARLSVSKNRFDWTDEQIQPPVLAVFDDCGLVITNLGFGGDPARYASSGAHVALYSNAADLVTKLNVTGTITTKPGPLDVAIELEGSASGITINRLQPYIDPTGIRENFVGATASGRCAAHVRREASGLVVDASADDFVFENDGQPILGLKSMKIDDARLESDEIRVRSIRVLEPRLVARRDPVGALLAAGLRIPLSVFEKGAVDSPSDSPATTSKAEDILASLPDIAIDDLSIARGVLAWVDESRTPAIGAEARLDLSVNSFATRRSAAPATFDIRIAVPGTAEKIDVLGTMNLDSKAATIQAHVHAAGLHAGALATYLPAGLSCELRDGVLEFDGRFAVGVHPEGGLSLDAGVGPFVYRESDAPEPLAAFSDLRLSATRIDPVALVFEFETISSDGIDLFARRGADGAFHALGFVLAPQAGAALAMPAANAMPAMPAATAAEAGRGTQFRFDRRPTIRIEHLELDLGRARFQDEMQGPDAKSIELTGKVSAGDGRIDAFHGPTTLVFGATALPLAKEVRGSLTLDISKDSPSFDMSIEIDGIRGEAITELVPSLAAEVDGSGLAHGRFTTGVHGVLSWRRRGPLDFDLRNGFAAEIRVDPLQFGEVRDGVVTPLAGLDGIDIDVKRFDPRTGDLHIATLDIKKPSGRFSRAPDGLHAFGLVLKTDTKNVEAVDGAPPSRDAVAVVTHADTKPAGEVRIDALTVRGIDVELRDTSSDPTTVVPLTDLDIEVLKFTTLAFREPRAVRFNAYVGAGEVDLPKRTRAANVLTGVFGSIGALAAGQPDAFEIAKHRVFDEIALSGRVAFFPALNGYAKLDLNTLELLAVAGTARDSGFTIGDGTLDSSVRVRFKGERGATVESTIVFTDLSLGEPKGGPIESYLHLPVPLDTALFLLENDAGEHRIPIHFDVTAAGIGHGAIVSAAVGAVSSVLVSALASAPLRIVGTFTDLLGLSGGEEEPIAPALVHYASAATVTEDDERQLAPILERLRDDSDLVVVLQHRFGRGDLERAAILANPSVTECAHHAARLRQRKSELLRGRAELVARARSEFGVGKETEAKRTSVSLCEVDQELGRVEALLDKTCDLLRPGAERAHEKRTKAAAFAIARGRLGTLRAMLVATGIEDIEKRIEMRSATLDVAGDDSPGTIVVAVKKRG